MVLQEQSLVFIRAYYYACYCSFNTSSHYFLDSTPCMHEFMIHSFENRFTANSNRIIRTTNHQTDSSAKILFISNVLQAILVADDECRTVERTPPGNQLQPIPTQEQINSLSPSSHYFQDRKNTLLSTNYVACCRQEHRLHDCEQFEKTTFEKTPNSMHTREQQQQQQ